MSRQNSDDSTAEESSEDSYESDTSVTSDSQAPSNPESPGEMPEASAVNPPSNVQTVLQTESTAQNVCNNRPSTSTQADPSILPSPSRNLEGPSQDHEPSPVFTTVTRNRRFAAKPKKPAPAPIPVQISNRFSQLNLATEVESPQTTAPPPKIPPLFLLGTTDWSQRSRAINGVCSFPPISVMSGQNFKITCQRVEDHRAVTKLLTEKGWEYFTYQLKEDKKKYFVIRGLPTDTPTAEITDDLQRRGITISSISQIQTSRPLRAEQARLDEERANNPDAPHVPLPKRKLPLFQISLASPEQEEILKEIPALLGLAIKIEDHKPSSGPPQCTRCQRFGHTFKTCGIQPKCVRCAAFHAPDACPLRNNPQLPAKCANCSGAHPSNYRQCTAYQTYAARVSATRQSTVPQTNPQVNPSNFPSLPNQQPSPLTRLPEIPTSAPTSPTPGPSQDQQPTVTPPQPTSPTSLPSLLSTLFSSPQPAPQTPSSPFSLSSFLSSLLPRITTLIQSLLNPPANKSRGEIIIEEIISLSLSLIQSFRNGP